MIEKKSMELKLKIIDGLQFLAPFVVVAICWEFIASLELISQFPAPSQLVMTAYRLSFEHNVLQKHLLQSLYRLIAGYFLAVVLGIAAGAAMGMKKWVAEAFSPILSLLISIPTIAWVPVLLITLGLGEETVITAIFLGGFFAITYSTMNGMRMVNKQLINAARIAGGNKISLFFHVMLPGSLFSIIPGLRLAIGYSWRALVGAEMLAALVKWGIGKMIYEARFWNDVKVIFLGLIIIGVIGMLIDRLLMGWIEKNTIEKWGMISER